MIISLFRDLVVPTLVQTAAFYMSAQDTAWQAKFRDPQNPAILISSLGVNDDSGVTDNTAALNALFSTHAPTTPIIMDCPHGGYISYSGVWFWASGLTVWQQPGCWLKNSQVIYGGYAIQQAGTVIATAPITNVFYEGFQFGFITPSNADRVMQLWVDHFKLKDFDIDGSGGFAFLRGSDQEIARGSMKNTITNAGNPGIRQFGNIPKVQASPGMKANNWYHELNFQTGDAAFQTCQPGSNPATWLFNTSSDDILYENSYGQSGGSSVILINENVSDIDKAHTYTYTCTNIKYINVSGVGVWGAIIGSSNNLTQDVLISGGTLGTNGGNGGIQTQPVVGVGSFNYGGSTASAPNTNRVTLENVNIAGYWQTALGVNGATNTTIINSVMTAPRAGATSTSPAVEVLASTNTVISGGSVGAGYGKYAVQDDNGSAGTTISGFSVTGVTNGKFGYYFGNSSGARLSSSSVTPAAGATTAVGISLATSPNGTSNAIVSGNTVSGMPVPVVCAPGQSNSVTSNTGVADCSP